MTRSRSLRLAALVLLPATLASCAPAVRLAESGPPERAAEARRLLEPGTSRKLLADEKAGPFRRSFRVHLPAGYDPNARHPLVVALHGGVATAAILERQSALSAVADRHGFVVIYPNGLGVFSLFRHWNGGWCCARAHRIDLDDVGYLDRLRAWADRALATDPRRHYVVGYSNGGMLAYLYAAERAPELAGLGIWASSLDRLPPHGAPSAAPKPEAPVPAVIAHGTADDRLPWNEPQAQGEEGGRAARLLGAVGSARAWARANGCGEEASERPGERRGVQVRSWCGDDRRRAVTLVGLEAWGHDWPGPRLTGRPKWADHPLAGFDLAETLWRLLSRP